MGLMHYNSQDRVGRGGPNVVVFFLYALFVKGLDLGLYMVKLPHCYISEAGQNIGTTGEIPHWVNIITDLRNIVF